MSEGYRWVTELSKEFLERDYLLPDQTIEDRVKLICKTAGDINGIPNFAERFEENFKKGWYSFSTPVWTNFGTSRGLPISCVVGDTIVDTHSIHKCSKLAKDIKVGDFVLTHKGRYREVTKVIISKSSKPIYRLHVQGKASIFITGDHPVLTELGWVNVEDLIQGVSRIAISTFGQPLKYADIQNLVMTTQKETVYDFTVDEDHSFCSDGVVLHNCFGSHISDNMESICGAWSEIAIMTKYGGGTSAYFGDIRPRGSDITMNGKSSGSVHFMQAFNSLINVISQGSTRRGSLAVYLPIDHGDIEEFLSIRTEGHPIQDLSFGVTIPEGWMQSMIDGDVDKRRVWAKVLEARNNVGYPYLFFADNANANKPEVYANKRINHTNLCVTGDQRVPSQFGMKTVRDLYELKQPLTLYDNEKVVKASEMKLIEKDAQVFKITLKNGMTHRVTSYHGVKTDKGVVECKDLKIGDKVAIQTTKGLFGTKHMPDEAFLLGHYQGDGTQYKDSIMLDLWENDFDLIDEIESKFAKIHKDYGCDTYKVNLPGSGVRTRGRKAAVFNDCCVRPDTVAKKRLVSKTLNKALNFKKGEVPEWIWESDEETQWQYLRGLLYTDGTVSIGKSNGNPIYLSYSSVNYEFLQQLQLLMRNLGIHASIFIGSKAGKALLPDGKGGKKLYDTKDCWRIVIGNKNDALVIESNTGFLTRKGVKLEDKYYRDNSKKFYKVESIEPDGVEDVYCCTVDSQEHLWVCNGIVTKNCSEISLSNDEDESFVCDLSSMNILYYDEWKDTDAVQLMVYFLDAVMTEFIEKASKIAYLERAVRFAERHRAIGIGWFGWHSYLQSKMIPFESMQAKLLTGEIAEFIKDKAHEGSRHLAEIFGEPEMCKGVGRRNTTLTAIAPTKSSAFIIGQASESTEAFKANVIVHDLAKGKFTLRNPYLTEVLEDLGQNTPEVWASIMRHRGSVQHLECLNQHQKDVFKTLSEISPLEVIIQASIRQKHIDQSQSTNLMIHPSLSTKQVNALYIKAWELGLKSLYYQYSVNAAQELTRDILTCVSCES